MIISKTPHRISLFGGSTDVKSFYSKHNSLLIGFAINKYCYLTLRKTPTIFNYKTSINYSRTEIVKNNADIQHDGVRGVLEHFKIKYGIDLSCLTDIPSQTGMGSSSSFIVGMINSLMKLNKKSMGKEELAKTAIYIERELLKEPGGLQDSIWSSYGGFNSIDINKAGDFFIKPLPVCHDFKNEFLRRSILVYTGKTRQSFAIAKSHDNVSAEKSKREILDIAKEAYTKFAGHDIDAIGKLLHESWQAKKRTSNLISSSNIDKTYKYLKSCGCLGGKLLGAGGSGFIYCILDENTDKSKLPRKIKKNIIDFGIDYEGSQIING